jgi:hypothetical protein
MVASASINHARRETDCSLGDASFCFLDGWSMPPVPFAGSDAAPMITSEPQVP